MCRPTFLHSDKTSDVYRISGGLRTSDSRTQFDQFGKLVVELTRLPKTKRSLIFTRTNSIQWVRFNSPCAHYCRVGRFWKSPGGSTQMTKCIYVSKLAHLWVLPNAECSLQFASDCPVSVPHSLFAQLCCLKRIFRRMRRAQNRLLLSYAGM